MSETWHYKDFLDRTLKAVTENKDKLDFTKNFSSSEDIIKKVMKQE